MTAKAFIKLFIMYIIGKSAFIIFYDTLFVEHRSESREQR